jgi:hypothetical protein
MPDAEVIRKAGISEQTFYLWKKEETVRWPGDGPGPGEET